MTHHKMIRIFFVPSEHSSSYFDMRKSRKETSFLDIYTFSSSFHHVFSPLSTASFRAPPRNMEMRCQRLRISHNSHQIRSSASVSMLSGPVRCSYLSRSLGRERANTNYTILRQDSIQHRIVGRTHLCFWLQKYLPTSSTASR